MAFRFRQRNLLRTNEIRPLFRLMRVFILSFLFAAIFIIALGVMAHCLAFKDGLI